MTDELISEYEERQKDRRRTVTKAVIDGKTIAETLTITGIHDDIIKSANDIPRPVLYISRNTKDLEKYTKLRHLLEGSGTVLITDHAPIKEVLRTAATTQYSLRLDKFRMLLAPFIDKLKVVYRLARE